MTDSRESTKAKATIWQVGHAYPPRDHDYEHDGMTIPAGKWLLLGWGVSGGDYPGYDATTGHVGGWSPEELYEIARVHHGA